MIQKIAVSLIGVGLVGFIYWFFFDKKEESTIAKDTIDVLVDGGYKPSVIQIRKGKKTTINLRRVDPSSCLEEFVLEDFKVKKYLPVGKIIKIELTPEKSGVYPFHCGMNMFHGKVIVE